MRKVLGLDESQSINSQQGLNSLGMDSLMAVELRSRLQSGLGCELPATVAFDHPSIAALAEHLLGQVLNFDTASAKRSAPEQAALLPHSSAAEQETADLDTLSETELESLLSDKLRAFGSPAHDR